MPATPGDSGEHRSASRLRLIGSVAALAMSVVGLAACGGEGDQAEGSPGPGREVSTPEGLLRWMARHPEKAGLVLLPDRGPALIDFGGERRFPLASTRKVLIVGALTESAQDLDVKIPRKAVERFYAPGSDGGAHERAGLDAPRLTLEEVAQAAIEVSDNAAADALLERVGSEAVDAWARGQGLGRQDPIYPLLGEYAAWTRDVRWTDRAPAERARRAKQLAARVSGRDVRPPAPEEQRRLAASSVAGVPAEWAALMRRIGHRGNPRLRELLDWPRRVNADTRKRFARFLTKGGSLAGVITEASYMRPHAGGGTAVALFLRDLPLDTWQALARDAATTELIARLGEDEAFRGHARELLAQGRRQAAHRGG